MMTKTHYYFMIPLSPWPFLVSINTFSLLFSLLILFKMGEYTPFLLNLLNSTLGAFMWWISYSAEFNLEGKDSMTLETGMKYAMILFISSEVFFFFSFFWAYFHFYMAPTMETGLVWPPFSVRPFDFLNVPLINTLLLLTSGLTVTVSHLALVKGEFSRCAIYLLTTVILGVVFTLFQIDEYNSSFFSISDSTFGASFFMLTGFHGIHVIIGTMFLFTTLFRMFKAGPSKGEYLSFELSSWYWHFVDVVWIFLYFVIYYLNS